MSKTTHLLTVRAEFDAPPSIGARSVVDVDGQRGVLRAGAFYDLFEVERIYEEALSQIKMGEFEGDYDADGAADHAEAALDRADAVRAESSRTNPAAPDVPVVPVPLPVGEGGEETGGTGRTAPLAGTLATPPTVTGEAALAEAVRVSDKAEMDLMSALLNQAGGTIDDLKAQRDALLAACEVELEYVETDLADTVEDTPRYWRLMHRRTALRTALAAARPTEAPAASGVSHD